ncbi:hypothetical protein AVEN_9957-1 [Araneus ventricosus]|uniref:Uncharacterized protein n=1 Tax=Araneus ventricosus TaxID=182803 RepID=A0A4Y2F9J0_ARAVE|nr:hypothetical protein AVEN_9957-1 [Araneus ventricosus]
MISLSPIVVILSSGLREPGSKPDFTKRSVIYKGLGHVKPDVLGQMPLRLVWCGSLESASDSSSVLLFIGPRSKISHVLLENRTLIYLY